MSSATTASILADLGTVDRERACRAADPVLARVVVSLKAYQQRRFERTYADLLASAEFGAASRFFLKELYGPRDFSARDAQFARVVPALVRLFRAEIIETVATLAELHALSETLDTRMAIALGTAPIDCAAYVAAWQATGTPAQRERQIALTLALGGELERVTRKSWLRHSLRLMRGAAHAAGLGALQEFLESGFDTFRAMSEPSRFLALVGERERALARALFACAPDAPLDAAGPLVQLP